MFLVRSELVQEHETRVDGLADAEPEGNVATNDPHSGLRAEAGLRLLQDAAALPKGLGKDSGLAAVVDIGTISNRIL